MAKARKEVSSGGRTAWPKGNGAGPAVYSSKIIKAGALLADTKTLLAHWDVATSVQDNVGRMRRDNLFGKASRSRVEDVLAIFRQRFLTEEAVTRALLVLVRGKLPAASLDRILLLRADLHTLFDLDLIGIESGTFIVRVHPDAKTAGYGGFDWLTLKCGSAKPSGEALALRWGLFLRRSQEA